MMPIFRINNKNVLFMHVPKAGGTSIEHWLEEKGAKSFHCSKLIVKLPCVPQHFHAALMNELFDPGFFDYKFMVVRNPYARIISEYNYRMAHRGRRARLLAAPSFDAWLKRTFSAYERDPFVYSNHIRPQVDFRMDGIEIFKLEDGLFTLKQRLCAVLDIQAGGNIPNKNRSRKRVARIGGRAEDLIGLFYEKDFARFQYNLSVPECL